MKKHLQTWLVRLHRWLEAKPDPADVKAENRVLGRMLEQSLAEREQENARRNFEAYMDQARELIEARVMCGAGPWSAARGQVREAEAALVRIKERALGLREMAPITSTGAFGDIELALQNVEWRREINLSWLEFSRWGIQQIILISRLYYIKNPMILRAINICSHYVFGRGCEVSSQDPDVNDAIAAFMHTNRKELGQLALAQKDKRLSYDGQVFFALFADKMDTGEVQVRTIDATEIQEVYSDPDDTDCPRYYLRRWIERSLNLVSGDVETNSRKCWYPALGYKPAVGEQLAKIGDAEVNWDVCVYHLRAGTGVSKWHFDVPRVYAALDWAKNARRYLEACLTTALSHAQIAWELSTKGGQQALEGAKQQLQTTVNAQPGNALWDTNPTAVNASIVAYGTGTKLSMLHARGQGGDPSEVKEYRNMVAITMDIPPTFLGDLETANLATATTLDRPTELSFVAKQETWRDGLAVIVMYALECSKNATSGRLAEALRKRKLNPAKVTVMEARRERRADGKVVYVREAAKDDEINIEVNFPAIREGDLPQLINAWAEAMTLGNKGGQVVGIDEKIGVLGMARVLGIEDAEEMVEEMYPEDEYEPDRTKEPLPAPVMPAQPLPGGKPQLPGGEQQPVVDKPAMAPAAKESAWRRIFNAKGAA